MALVSTLSYAGAAVIVVGWICRKIFQRSFGIHDETNEENITGKIVSLNKATHSHVEHVSIHFFFILVRHR